MIKFVEDKDFLLCNDSPFQTVKKSSVNKRLFKDTVDSSLSSLENYQNCLRIPNLMVNSPVLESDDSSQEEDNDEVKIPMSSLKLESEEPILTQL